MEYGHRDKQGQRAFFTAISRQLGKPGGAASSDKITPSTSAQRLANYRLAEQGTDRNASAVPQLCKNIPFMDQMVMVLHKHHQYSQSLWLDIDLLPIFNQIKSVGIQLEIQEPAFHVSAYILIFRFRIQIPSRFDRLNES